MADLSQKDLRVAGLFAGIGGIELGLGVSGHRTELLCEINEAAQCVLREQVPGVAIHGDIATLDTLPPVELIAAGFPCQDLSQAGHTVGISGSQSSLVEHIFRLLDSTDTVPTWLLLENVRFMLSLDHGSAMHWLVDRLEARGFTWAYRVVDTLAFGLPQRRQRVLLLASRTMDPRPPLLNQREDPTITDNHEGMHGCGFYWTEGLRGLGWAVDAVPPLKGGSTIGIPSPPAIWIPGSGRLVTPDLRDAERLQGFPVNWTIPASSATGRSRSDRWKLVGNAVSVPVARWLGERLMTDETYDEGEDLELSSHRWPQAAWGQVGVRREVPSSMWPVQETRPHLIDFLEFEPKSLSARATAGFLARVNRGNLRIAEDFLCEARAHLNSMTPQQSLFRDRLSLS